MAIAAFYWVTFVAFAVPAALLELGHGSGLFSGSKGALGGAGGRHGREYVKFRNNYLVVFALMMGRAGAQLAGAQQWPFSCAPTHMHKAGSAGA